MGYPPAAALLNLIVRSQDEDKGRDAAAALGSALRDRARGGYRVLGPARAPLARLRQEHRFQILLKGVRKAMREATRACLVARYGETRWPGVSVDVDPLTVL
jgi:primosomal protein N' (replication factor Y)